MYFPGALNAVRGPSLASALYARALIPDRLTAGQQTLNL